MKIVGQILQSDSDPLLMLSPVRRSSIRSILSPVPLFSPHTCNVYTPQTLSIYLLIAFISRCFDFILLLYDRPQPCKDQAKQLSACMRRSELDWSYIPVWRVCVGRMAHPRYRIVCLLTMPAGVDCPHSAVSLVPPGYYELILPQQPFTPYLDISARPPTSMQLIQVVGGNPLY